ncbi:unnamed protein product, partial [Symbiodinium natans]
VILLAIGLFSSCISAISSAMASLRTARSEKSQHQAKLFQFFNDRKLSIGLYGKVQEVLEKAQYENFVYVPISWGLVFVGEVWHPERLKLKCSL